MSDFADRYRTLAAEFTRRVEAVPDDAVGGSVTVRGVVGPGRPAPRRRDPGDHAVVRRRGDQARTLGRRRSGCGAGPRRGTRCRTLLDDPARAGKTYEGMFGPTTLEKTVDTFIGLDL